VKLIDFQLIYGVAGAREQFEDLAAKKLFSFASICHFA
jgi:hypothetical protein